MSGTKDEDQLTLSSRWGRPATFRLRPGALVREAGGRSVDVPLAQIRELRLLRETPGRREVRLLALDGRRLTLSEARAPAPGAFPHFASALVDRLSRTAPPPVFVLGTTQARWIAALTGLVASVALMVAALWILMTGGALAEVAAPVAVAAVNLAIVLPIARTGRPRHVEPPRLHDLLRRH